MLEISQFNDKLTSASTGPRRNRRTFRRLVERLVMPSMPVTRYEPRLMGTYDLLKACFWGQKDAFKN